ncbi:MAG: metalloregulator ArsR/SmtB family transcription factor [Candidatus Thiodiazotropha sp.]
MIYAEYDIYQKMNINPDSVFSALANSTRLRCIVLLLKHRELCVCELTQAIGAAQPSMSRNLAQLREVGLVSDRREGQWIYYRINPDLPEWVLKVLKATALGSENTEPYRSDKSVLAGMLDGSESSRCA